MKSQIKLNIFLYYLALGIVISIYTNVFPKVYEVLGFSKYQISILIAIPFIGALFQIIIGYISDYTKKYVGVIKLLLYTLVLTSIALFFVNSFISFLIILLILSIARFPLFVLSDNIMLHFTNKNKLNFGTLKKGSSIGFGASLVLVLPFYLILGVKSIFIILILLTVMAIYLIGKIPKDETFDDTEEEPVKLKDLKLLVNNHKALLLLSFQFIFMGVSSLKFSYQILKFSTVTDNTLYPAIALVCATVPEIMFLHLYPKIKKKINLPTNKILFIIPLINIVQMILFLTINNPLLLIGVATIHGFGMMFYIPGYISYLREATDEKIRATTMVLGTTLQALFALILGFVLAPIYDKYHIQGVYIVFIVMLCISLIPLVLLNIQENKKKGETI